MNQTPKHHAQLIWLKIRLMKKENEYISTPDVAFETFNIIIEELERTGAYSPAYLQEMKEHRNKMFKTSTEVDSKLETHGTTTG